MGISEVGQLINTLFTRRTDVSLKNIRGAYSFLCANYSDGDEIILVGFSR